MLYKRYFKTTEISHFNDLFIGIKSLEKYINYVLQLKQTNVDEHSPLQTINDNTIY